MNPSIDYTIIILAKNEDLLLHGKINDLLSSSFTNFSIIVSNYGNFSMSSIDRVKILNDCTRGIYDSINKAIKYVTTTYYIVCGLDDIILIKNLSKINFNEIHQDIIIFNIIKDNKKFSYFRPNRVVCGPNGVFPSHTVGLLIKASLHDRYGMYSLHFKVISDCYFIGKAILGGCTCKLVNLTSGIVGSAGFSFQNQFLSEKECFLVRKEFGLNFLYNYSLYTFRLIRRILKRIVYNNTKNI